jgi:hypothetical protein
MAGRSTALMRLLQVEDTMPCVRDDIIAKRGIALTF